MHDTLADDLQPVLVRWTMGGQAASIAPERISRFWEKTRTKPSSVCW